MMREIKFRVWDSRRKEMLHEDLEEISTITVETMKCI